MRPAPPRRSPAYPAATPAILVALLSIACAKAPSAHTCASHADCPSGTTCQLGVCQEGLALDFTSPAVEVTITRGTVAVQVAVAGQVPAAVQLLVDEVVVATLTPPFSQALDTASLTEGSHVLVASALLGGRTFRSPPRTLVVDRTAPAAPTVGQAVTNAADPVPVSGTAEAGASVAVYEGATLLASGVVAGAGGAWSAAFPLTPGSHGLTATATDAAGNVSLASAVTNVVVDRTAPTVVASAPAPAATNVWSRDPITVTFSEAMKSSTVTSATVLLTRSGGASIDRTLGLSPDGLTLTITPTSLPAVPDVLQVTLTVGLTDLAGNSLALTSWSWSLPEWQDLGAAWTSGSRANITWFALAVGPSGLPVVAANALGVVSGNVVTRYTGSGTTWSDFPIPTWSGLPSSGVMAVTAQDRPVLAWLASTDVRAALWDGAAWSGNQVLDITLANTASAPSVGLDEAGAPYVAWVETVGTLNQVFARRWSGSTWAQLGSGALSSATVPAAGPSASVGAARVTWTETDATPTTTVRSNVFAGGIWGATPLSAPLTAPLVGGAPLASPAGTAFLLAPGTTVQAWQWVLGASPIPNHWQQILPNLDVGAGAVSFPSMAVDPAGQPVVAWNESPGGAYVKRYDGTLSAWVNLTSSGPLLGSNRVTVGPGGIVAVAWLQSLGLSTAVRVFRYNR